MLPGAITTADLFRELTNMTVRLAVIEATTTRSEQVHSDHEVRLRAVERFRWALFGGASVIGALSGIATALLATRGH